MDVKTKVGNALDRITNGASQLEAQIGNDPTQLVLARAFYGQGLDAALSVRKAGLSYEHIATTLRLIADSVDEGRTLLNEARADGQREELLDHLYDTRDAILNEAVPA